VINRELEVDSNKEDQGTKIEDKDKDKGEDKDKEIKQEEEDQVVKDKDSELLDIGSDQFKDSDMTYSVIEVLY